MRLLRFHGSQRRRDFELVGYNSRLDELQAAFLRVFLPKLDEWNRLRREAAERYRELGLGELVEVPEDEPGHVYHLFVCRSPERDRIRAALGEAGIGNAAVLPAAAPSAARAAVPRLRATATLPETERAAARELLASRCGPGSTRRRRSGW